MDHIIEPARKITVTGVPPDIAKLGDIELLRNYEFCVGKTFVIIDRHDRGKLGELHDRSPEW